jgi:addiction module HigA family antidote
LITDDVGLPYEAFFETMPVSHRRFFREMRLFHESDGAVFVHAGVDPSVERFFKEGRLGKGMGWASVNKIAARKLDVLNYAEALSDLAPHLETGSKLSRETSWVFIASESMINGEWFFDGPMLVPWTSIYEIITERTVVNAMRRQRKPTSPGEILREEYLIPLGMTQKQLANHLGCDVKVVNRLVNGRTSVTAEMALKLGATFRTTAGFWLNAQKAVDLYLAAKRLKKLPKPLLRAS